MDELREAAGMAKENPQGASEIVHALMSIEGLRELYAEQKDRWPVVDGDPFQMDMVTFYSTLNEVKHVLLNGHVFTGEQTCVQLVEAIAT